MGTKTYSAPVSGTPLFRLDADLAVPTRTNINELRERLDQLQRDENIDLDTQEAQKAQDWIGPILCLLCFFVASPSFPLIEPLRRGPG